MGVIAGNTQYGGRSNRGYAESWTREQVDSLLAEAWLRQMVSDIRGGNEKLKDKLPFICPHYGQFKNNHRAQKDIMPETFTFMTCVDVDDKELVDKAIRRALEVNGDEYSDWQDQVLRIEYSARKKVHIYIRIPKGMTIEEAQRAFCQEIEVPYDESCITPERFIYVTGCDEEVYRLEHWLEPIPEKELEERREAYLQRGLDVDGRPLSTQRGRFRLCTFAGTQTEPSPLCTPEMPGRVPKLVQLLISKTPKVYQPAVAHAVFPPLGTHLCNVRFTYTDNVEHEATLMNCLMAGTGAGKGCIDKPIERIMADIERRDKENERREAEWKKDCQKKGANKDKLLRPEGLVIQVIDSDMTKPALVTRMDEAEGHFVYVKLNELDLFEQLKGATGKQHFQLMCLAFDSDATYGQTRIGTQSVTARPMCRFNWNACTTILKGRRFFKNVLTDGPISRINFCTIPEQEIGAEQPIYGQYDAAFDEALKPYIDNLVNARGLIACPQAYKLAKKLQAECAEFARLSQNDTYWNLSHRACVIAWLKACVLYVANGQKWERSIEDFIRWSLNYDLWCKMQFFGNRIEAANNSEDSRIGTRGPRNLLSDLPDEFTTEDAKMIRQRNGKSADGTKKMISQWKTRGYILQLTVDSFQKSDKYRTNHES